MQNFGIKCESSIQNYPAAHVYAILTSAGDKYRGEYKLDESTGVVSGNPARSADVKDILKTVANKCGSDGGTRNHTEAITIEDMEKLMDWSRKQFSGDPQTVKFKDAVELADAARHYLMRAFMSSGFTLWTRYEFRNSLYYCAY